ncbi:hypothetical protein LPJ68_006042, partial [Coemansia sp. RSA 1086]
MDVGMAIRNKRLTMSSESNLKDLLNDFYTPPMSGLGSTLQAENNGIIADYEDLKRIIKAMRKAIFDNPNVP